MHPARLSLSYAVAAFDTASPASAVFGLGLFTVGLLAAARRRRLVKAAYPVDRRDALTADGSSSACNIFGELARGHSAPRYGHSRVGLLDEDDEDSADTPMPGAIAAEGAWNFSRRALMDDTEDAVASEGTATSAASASHANANGAAEAEPSAQGLLRGFGAGAAEASTQPHSPLKAARPHGSVFGRTGVLTFGRRSGAHERAWDEAEDGGSEAGACSTVVGSAAAESTIIVGGDEAEVGRGDGTKAPSGLPSCPQNQLTLATPLWQDASDVTELLGARAGDRTFDAFDSRVAAQAEQRRAMLDGWDANATHRDNSSPLFRLSTGQASYL